MYELRRCIVKPHEQLQVVHDLEDISVWQCVLTAPDDPTVPYYGGAWRLLVEFPDEYPAKAPNIFFVTPMLHLNVNAQGRVCHSALLRDYMPDSGIDHLLQCVVALLVAPDAESPFNEHLAMLYRRRLHQTLFFLPSLLCISYFLKALTVILPFKCVCEFVCCLCF